MADNNFPEIILTVPRKTQERHPRREYTSQLLNHAEGYINYGFKKGESSLNGQSKKLKLKDDSH
jgi:hypothetical protein